MHKKLMMIPASVALVLVLAACGGSSDAARVVESDNISLRATIAYYQNMGPTMTAQAVIAVQQMATLQFDLSQARQQVQNLTIRLNNAQGGIPTQSSAVNPGRPTVDPSVQTPIQPVDTSGGGFGSFPTATPFVPGAVQAGTPAPTPVPVQIPSGMTLESITTAKNKDDNGCASEPTNAFKTSDTQIWVVAVAKRFRAGTKFEVKWSGSGFEQHFEWTTERRGTQMCVHFYIEPTAVNMAVGTYTVVLLASDNTGTAQIGPITFTVSE